MLQTSRQLRGFIFPFIRRQLFPSLENHSMVACSLFGIRSISSSSLLLQRAREQEKGNDRGTDLAFHSDRTISGTRADRPIARLAVDHCAKMLKVCWEENEVEEFPFVWLKENCSCPACYHEVSHSRLTHPQDIDVEIELTGAEVLEGGKQVEVVWKDGHRSTYKADWLYSHRFCEANRQARNRQFRLQQKFWGSESLDKFPRAVFQDVITDDLALLEWLTNLEVYGLVMLDEAPTETGQLRRLADRIAFIKRTHYGEVFTVKAKANASNAAYLSGQLDLHGDLPYYEQQPGVQSLHCIVQSESVGGDSLLSDGIHVAHQLKKVHPEYYRILANTPIDWHDKGTDEFGEFNKHLRVPIICTNSSGEVTAIKFNHHQQDSLLPLPVREVSAWYTALIAYYRLLTDPQYCLKFKMTPGTIVTFDNTRVLHGRTGYLPGQVERHLEGCYFDWDEVRSRRRVLESKI